MKVTRRVVMAGILGAALAIGLPIGIAQAQGPQQPAPAGVYNVDNGHSSIVFRIKNRGVTYVYGRFDEMQGSVTYDPADAAKMAVQMTVNAASIDTNNGKRDDHLRTPDFFNVAANPTISFQGSGAKSAGGNYYEMPGTLTFMGVAKPLNIRFEITGTASGERGSMVGAHCSFNIKRSDFGMTYGVGKGIEDEVTVNVSVQANS